MRKSVFLLAVLTVLFFVSLFVAEGSRFSSGGKAAGSDGGVTVFFFYGEGCPHCARVEPFIEEMVEKHGIRVERFEVYGDRGNMLLMRDYFERFGVPVERRGVPAVFTQDSYIVGDADILKNFEDLILNSSRPVAEQAETVSESEPEADGSSENSAGSSISLLALTTAALVDSINPCSMAILFFLLAGLLLLKKRGKALKVGLAFTLSVFVANLLFGFGILSTIAVSGLSSTFKVAAGLFAVLTGVLLLKDAFRYGAGGFVMEVPRFLRPYLKRRLSKAFFGRSSGPLAAFLVGFLVSCFEVPCTGGPYFYVLAGLADEATRLETIPLLLFYNLIFVMPLVLITLLLYFGSVHVERAREWKEQNKQLIDLARGLPMIAVGLVTVPSDLLFQAAVEALSVYRGFALPLIGVVAVYIVGQRFSRRKERVKASRWISCLVLTTTVFFALMMNVQTTVNFWPRSSCRDRWLERLLEPPDDSLQDESLLSDKTSSMLYGITVVSPLNSTYSTYVPLVFEVNGSASWVRYSLDGGENVTIRTNVVLALEDGSHSIVLYAGNSSVTVASRRVHFTVDSSLFSSWDVSFVGYGSYPVTDLVEYDGNLYSVSNGKLYMLSVGGWKVIEAPGYVSSLGIYNETLYVSGKNWLYSFNGTGFTRVISMPGYVKVLDVYNSSVYVGAVLSNASILYYCSGSCENGSNWHLDTEFSSVASCSGVFCSVGASAVYENRLYVTLNNAVYSFNGTGWKLVKVFDDVSSFLDMEVYDGKLYLATRDQNSRCPLYLGGSGFCGRVLAFDGQNWTAVFDHDYWIYSLTAFNGSLYAGTANKIYVQDEAAWKVSFNTPSQAYYAITLISFNNRLYAGTGNGYIIKTPVTTCTDNDGDGYATEGWECGPIDCDDSDPSVNPNATEVCDDGIDNDCDGLIDNDDPDCECNESPCVIITIYHNETLVPDGTLVVIYDPVTSSDLASTTTVDGVADFGCELNLIPEYEYWIVVYLDGMEYSAPFTTNCAGGANVTVTI